MGRCGLLIALGRRRVRQPRPPDSFVSRERSRTTKTAASAFARLPSGAVRWSGSDILQAPGWSGIARLLCNLPPFEGAPMRLSDIRSSRAWGRDHWLFRDWARLLDTDNNVVRSHTLIAGPLPRGVRRRSVLSWNDIVRSRRRFIKILIPTDPTGEFLTPHKGKTDDLLAALVATPPRLADAALLEESAGATLASCHGLPTFRQPSPTSVYHRSERYPCDMTSSYNTYASTY